jgi:hypothetical protein
MTLGSALSHGCAEIDWKLVLHSVPDNDSGLWRGTAVFAQAATCAFFFNYFRVRNKAMAVNAKRNGFFWIWTAVYTGAAAFRRTGRGFKGKAAR